jgi:oligopeptide transport system substrate-binding protein
VGQNIFSICARTGKFSNGDPITANDFVFTIRRGFKPELASRNASLGYYIKYSEAYNSNFAFVKNVDGKFLLKKDFVDMVEASTPQEATPAGDSAFHKFLDEPERLTIPTVEKDRTKLLDSDPKLKAAVAGKELVPVKAEDIGVEAIDDYTLRLKLYQAGSVFHGAAWSSVLSRRRSESSREVRRQMVAAGEHRHERFVQAARA